MFGYVKPCKMELKIKDYEKFKAYYCGLCKNIKSDFGNLPRLTLNYDMTFLAILLDSTQDTQIKFEKHRCLLHPMKKKIVVSKCSALSYAAFCNVALTYYKLLDNVYDDKSIFSKLYSMFLNSYFKRTSIDLKNHIPRIESKLNELYSIENNPGERSLDEVCHPFAELTGIILSSYKKDYDKDLDLYWLGYYLGKWIYIIDAFDDLEKDTKKNKFNAINSLLNKDNLPYDKFSNSIKERIDFLLVSCAEQCLQHFNNLSIKRNKDLLYNILQYGLMERMDIVFKKSYKDARSEYNNEKSI